MIKNMLDASTAHITEETSNKFLEGAKYDGVTVTSKPYGYFISFCLEDSNSIAEMRKDEDIPSDLVDLLEYASMRNAYFVNLDTDADLVDGLRAYEW